MSVVSKNSSKKSKKKKKEVSVSPNESESSEEELDLTKEIHCIGHYINDRPEMINQMFSVIKGNKLKTMLPPILKDYDIEKLKLQCLDQLLGMSEKRISCLLEGEVLDTSSESDVASNDTAVSSSSSSQHKKKRKSDSESIGNASKVHKIAEPAAPEKGKTLLEILELEMRARAIRALLKQGSVETVDNFVVDLTEEPIYPTVIKTEPASSEQEQTFEEIVKNSALVEKAEKKLISKELELRNKIFKKKIYRTRQQRLANEDVPKVNETAAKKAEMETITNEPETIEVEEPEEGEVSSDDEIVVKDEKPDFEILESQISLNAQPKPVDGIRICAINDGVFVPDENMSLLVTPTDSDCVINLEDDKEVEDVTEEAEVGTVIIDLDDDSLDNVPEEIESADATTWRERWLQNDHVKKVVNTSKLVGLVKKRLAQKKTVVEQEVAPAASATSAVAVAELLTTLEGKVSEYVQLKEPTVNQASVIK